MNSLLMGGISFSCLLAGASTGFFLSRWLPEHHLSSESRDAIKMAWGIVATMCALVLGLLLAAGKNTFDTVGGEVTQASAKIIVLNHLLARYGNETKGIRLELRDAINVRVRTVWPESGARAQSSLEEDGGMERVQDSLNGLEPHNEVQRSLVTQARQICSELLLTRWLVITQSQNALPNVFFFILVVWLTILFAGIGLLTPRNGTVVVALLLCNLALAGAIFLIGELGRPLDGFVKVSSAPMRKAIEHLSQPAGGVL